MPRRAAEVVEYVDTSAYESYEKQEGDFIEPGAEPAVDSVVDPTVDPAGAAEPEPDNSVKGAGE